jgi:hypothetical protein
MIADSTDEAAAYVAGALYCEYAGVVVPVVKPQFVKAAQIAKSIMNKPGAMVSAQDEGHLRTFVFTRMLYWNAGMTYDSTGYR